VIYLLAVVKSKVIDEYGFHSVLKKFIADINHLEVCVINKCMCMYIACIHVYIMQTSGIEVAVSGRNIVYKGGMQLFLADTVAAH